MLHTEHNLFDELQASLCLEDVGRGRQGTVLVVPDDKRGTPIVRTTTKYLQPAQCFRPVHVRLAAQIRARVEGAVGPGFNNALIETYTNAYTKMGFHSDQGGCLLVVFFGGR